MITELGMPNPGFENPGPLPPYDHCGYRVAVFSVYDSLQPGKYSATHKQWETVRRLRSVFTNQAWSATAANSSHLGIGDMGGKDFRRIVNDPCMALWFTRWVEGCKRRMGQDVRPNQAIDLELLRNMLNRVETLIQEALSIEEVLQWSYAGSYFLICYVLALRGNKGLMLDAEEMLMSENESDSYVIYPLKGKVKGEHHRRSHKMISVKVTDSGIDVASWHARVIGILQLQGRTAGPVYVDESGVQVTTNCWMIF